MTQDTKSREYARRLVRKQAAFWKVILDVQAPYRWNLRRLRPGRTLEIGCGIGRNLGPLGPGSVGVDHNDVAVQICHQRGYEAYTPGEFAGLDMAGGKAFDTLLFSHVLEHMTLQEATQCVAQYLTYLNPAGRIILMTPQEAGFQSDPSHVEFMPFEKLSLILSSYGFWTSKAYSFPFPRWIGKIFRYNEFVVVGERLR